MEENNEIIQNSDNQENIQFKNRIDLSELQEAVNAIRREIHQVVIGQYGMTNLLVASILANGHSLIEGVP
jgi:MoxR-like ATPase